MLLLPRVYDSLCAQSFRDFEWIIVDDGSTDHTAELVASWRAFFPIRYYWKPNGGQHTALNLGVEKACGELTAFLDNDDFLLPSALRHLDHHWGCIRDKSRFAGVVGLCCQEDGKAVLGRPYPTAYVETFGLKESRALTQVDRWGAMRTDLLRQYPYPVFPGERIMDLGVTQNRIIRRYAMRYFNEPLQVHHYLPDGITKSGDTMVQSTRCGLVPLGAPSFGCVAQGAR